ncbi:MAG TPA: Ppx/GppA phosphatase family protein [Acidimicrobiales bacterium]|nr:Ppx/GppA phosphatase family protein [Acidimicrobiales bacterium]
MGEHLAAIDIGTNSIHLVVARFDEAGHFEVIADEKEPIRLGSAGGDMKELQPDAIDRGIEALTRMRRVAEISGARVVAVATSAVREAENAQEFLDRARHEAGVEVEVISGTEEARLIHLGILQAVPVFDRRHLMIDIGGGSTEVLVGEGSDILAVRSFKLGAIRLTRRFFRTDRVHPGAVDACRRYIDAMLAPLAREVDRLGYEVAVGSSGTIEAVASIIQAADAEGRQPRTIDNATFTYDDAHSLVRRLAGLSVAKRKTVPGLEASRADIVLAGAIIVEQAMSTFGIEELTVSRYALREGALLDAFQRTHGGALHHLHDLRRRSVVRLADMMDEEPAHSAHAARLALQLFDETADLHGLGDADRELLEAAALLANVGLFVSHTKHHKHTYYVIRNSDHLTGFTDHEIEVIAQVARYHRKSAPSAKHPEFAALRRRDQEAVRAMAGILRVAIGLDRTHAGRVTGLRCRTERRELVVEVECEPGADISLELYTATERRALLEQVLDRRIEVVAAEPLTPPVDRELAPAT